VEVQVGFDAGKAVVELGELTEEHVFDAAKIGGMSVGLRTVSRPARNTTPAIQ